MSFSADIKEELSKISNLANKDLVKWELVGYLMTNNVYVKNGKIKYTTENKYNINRFAKLISNMGINNYNIDIQGKIFSIIVNEKIKMQEISTDNDKILVNYNNANLETESKASAEQIEKAIIRGNFLGSGSINNPENKYHLEVIYNSSENLAIAEYILNKYNVQIKQLNTSLYIKDGEQISNFLAFIGASNAVLKFEEIRVIRDMRNNVNRLVNCETANLNKTIDAAIKQIEDIKLIKKKKKFGELSDNLQEIANLRLENPEISLVELGKMLKNPVGKSGVNYRLKAISKFANELR